MSATNSMQAFLAVFAPAADGVTPITGLVDGGGTGAVTQTATPSMQVQISPATWLIPGPAPTSQGAFMWTPGTSTQTLTHDPADATNPRVDIIVAQVNNPGSTTTAGDASYAIVKGTPAASPTAPPTPTGTVFIRNVAIGAGSGVVITNANITGTPTKAAVRLPTQVARGRLAYATMSGDTTGITTTETNLNGLGGVAFTTLGSNRTVRITLDLGMFSTVANDEVRIRAYVNGAGPYIDKYLTLPTANRSTPMFTFSAIVGMGGSYTVRVTAVRSAGSGNITVQSARSQGLFVEDVGV